MRRRSSTSARTHRASRRAITLLATVALALSACAVDVEQDDGLAGCMERSEQAGMDLEQAYEKCDREKEGRDAGETEGEAASESTDAEDAGEAGEAES